MSLKPSNVADGVNTFSFLNMRKQASLQKIFLTP